MMYLKQNMEVASSNHPTSICNHCDKEIPSSNIDLHSVHCSRNLEKCKVCSDMISKRYAEEHYLNTHTPVSCTLCGETMQREVLAVHKGENCPQRIETCEYCEFPLPAMDLVKHQEVCGNRTELCHLCNKYIRLREKNLHEISCNGVASSITESSRNTQVSERARNGPRRRPNEFSRRSMLITIAITGTAVLLSSLFFQKKTESNQVH